MRMQPSPFRILIYEFVTGGGWPEAESLSGLAGEGMAMLQAILTDFQLWGQAYLITTLDTGDRSYLQPYEAARSLIEGRLSKLADLAAQVDAALIIAPESDGILTRLSSLVEEIGTQLLGTSSRGVAIAGNKWDCFLRFRQDGLPTPNTRRTSCAEAAAVAEELGFPLVVKPVDGVGCEGVSLVSDSSSLDLALELISSMPKDVLLQQYLAGTHASVSLLASAAGVLPLSLNEQIINLGIPFQYEGGVVPLEHRQRHQAMAYARRAVSLVPGLRGYVGVDMVLAENQCYVIEINPRLTTSYVGLRQVININLAEAIWRACIENMLPQNFMLSGKASFRKEDFSVVRNA
jgi:predicted ATP-grasp superfamily ATP-dependent carboligase